MTPIPILALLQGAAAWLGQQPPLDPGMTAHLPGAVGPLLPDWVVLVFAGFVGACVGSFLNVVVWRLPRNCLSISKPRHSFCPACKAPIRWFDNIPVASWFILRGKCRNCHGRISFRYPAVEAFTAAMFVVVVWLDVAQPGPQAQTQLFPWLTALTHAIFISIMIAAALIDADLTVIPDQLTWGGTAVILLLAFANPMHGGVPHSKPEKPGRNVPVAIESYELVNPDRMPDRPNVLIIEGVKFVRRPAPVLEAEGKIWIQLAPLPRTQTQPVRIRVPNAVRIGKITYRIERLLTPEGWLLTPISDVSQQALVANQWPASTILPEVSGPDGHGDAVAGWTPHLRSFLGAFFGALIAGGGMWLLRGLATGLMIRKALRYGQGAAMGLGDVKLLMLSGAMLGWPAALISIFGGAALGLVVTLPMLAMKKQHLFPFGPFLAAAAVALLLFHGPAISALFHYWAPLLNPGAGGY